jgi:ATP-binding cassette, subfamily B, bacterial
MAKQTIYYFWCHAWRYKGYLLGLILSVPLATLFLTFLPPLIVARILQRLSTHDFVPGDLWASFGGPLLWYAIISVLGGVIFWRVAVYFVWKLEMKVTRDIIEEVFDHLLVLSANFHANRFGGSLVSQSNKLVTAYVRFADTTIFALLLLLLSFIFSFVILLPRAPWIATFLLVFSGIFMAMTSLITKRVRDLRSIEANASNTQTGALADAITNVLAVKSFAGGPHERARFHKVTSHTMSTTHDVMVASIKRDTVFGFGTMGMSVVALVLAIGSAVTLHANIATAFLVVSYTSLISQKLWEFAQHILRDYNRAFGEAQDMLEILAIQPEIKDPAASEKVRIKAGAIEFDHVNFTHPDTREDEILFEDLTLKIKAGEKVGLVGHSGSGKTTFTKLLLHFMDVDGGEILIDGQDISKITQDDLRRHIAYVPQEPLLFHRSIKENIAYGKTGATDSEITAAAKRAYAHEFIKRLPKGYDTLVGERGVKLSGGQRQRVAIARAMLKNAPILVLDEATSALDSESEMLIQSALWELMEKRTAIIIAHRLSTIQRMDRIVVLDDGEIVEQGTHQTLLSAKGTYAKLWAHQSGGFIED